MLFAPELGRSLAPLRKSGGVLGELWGAWRAGLGRHDEARDRRWVRPGWKQALVVAVALAGGGYALAVLLKGLLLVLVPEAHAQVLLGEADEKTRELLDFLYGIARGEGAGVGEMLRYFNAGMTVVVAVLLIYQVLFAVVETGRTGEGRLTGWQMMRFVLVVGLMFPLPATGMGPGQHLLLGLTDVSGSLAAGVWQRFAGVVVGGGAGAPVPLPRGYREMVARMVVLETCLYVHNQVAAAQASDGPYITVQREEDDDEVRYWYRDPAPWQRHRPCGLVTVSTEPEGDNEGARIMAGAHAEAIRSTAFVAGLQGAAREIGDRFLSDRAQFGRPLPDVDAWLEGTGLVERYGDVLRARIGRATQAARDTLDEEVRTAVEREGWLAAASFFLVIARNQAVFLDAVGAVPEVSAGGRFVRGWGVVEPWDEAGPVVAQWLADSEAAGASGRVTQAHGQGWWSGLFDWLPTDWVTVLDETNPLEALSRFGYGMLYAGMSAVAAGEAANWIPGMRTVGGVTGLGERVGAMARAIGVALMIGGIVLAFVIPMIPFARFLFGVIAWVLSVVEAIIAIPLFLAVQIAGQDRGLVTRSATGGYLLLLHAVVRPALMVLGLVLGYFIFLAVVALLNWLYAAQLEALADSTRLGLLTYVISLVIYVVLVFGVTNAAFKAVDVVPQEVLSWLGGRVRAGGDEGASLQSMKAPFSRLSALRSLGRGGR